MQRQLKKTRLFFLKNDSLIKRWLKLWQSEPCVLKLPIINFLQNDVLAILQKTHEYINSQIIVMERFFHLYEYVHIPALCGIKSNPQIPYFYIDKFCHGRILFNSYVSYISRLSAWPTLNRTFVR